MAPLAALCEEYTARDGQDRLLVGEVSVADRRRVRRCTSRPDELHQAFFFHLLSAPWDAAAFRGTIVEALRDIAGTGSTVTWVLNNHDQVRPSPASTRSGAGRAPPAPAPPRC